MVFSKYFISHSQLFDGGKFGPTGEDSVFYQHPPHPDTTTLKGMEREDLLTTMFINNARAIFQKIGKMCGEDPEAPRQDIGLDTIHMMMNFFTCLYAPILFTASLAVLYTATSTKIQIVVAGGLGMLLALSVQSVVPGIKRGEVVAITAAYFAIAGIFIGPNGPGGR